MLVSPSLAANSQKRLAKYSHPALCVNEDSGAVIPVITTTAIIIETGSARLEDLNLQMRSR